MAEPVVVVDLVLVDEAERVIGKGLSAFNDEVAGINDSQPWTVVVQDPDTGAVLGGVSGRTSLGLLFFNVFHLPKQLRGAGLGSRILHMAEEEARRRGCCSGVLLTISFQAPDFYERHGRSDSARMPDFDSGRSCVAVEGSSTPTSAIQMLPSGWITKRTWTGSYKQRTPTNRRHDFGCTREINCSSKI